jgi:hypothetical protein
MSILNQIIGGAFLSSVSVFFLAIETGSYALVVLFVLTLSLGEALWSPRLMEYSATISPPVRVAIFQNCSD